MNLWYKKSLVLLLGGLVYGAGYFFSNPAQFGFCSGQQSVSYICRVPGITGIGWPLIALGQILAIVWFILLFANAETLRRWLKVSALYIPVAVILSFMIYPIRFFPGAELLPVSYGVYPFGSLYILITLSIVLWGWWKGRYPRSG